jgi:hypothetical protein
MEESLKGEMRLTVSAMEDKMEAIVHSIRSEQDGKIQRRSENVMERQGIPKEEAAVHTMRAWQEETLASLECKEQGLKELESEVERREVPTEEAAVKSSGITKKRHRGRHSCRATQRAKRADPNGLGISGEVGCHLQEGVPPCSSGMAKRTSSRIFRPTEIVDPGEN